MSTMLSISASIAERAVKSAVGLEAKIKAGMAAVLQDNWMALDDDTLMRGALAAVLLDVGQDSEDGKRLIETIEALKKFSAFIVAAQAGLFVDPLSIVCAEGTPKPLPIVEWWRETKAAQVSP